MSALLALWVTTVAGVCLVGSLSALRFVHPGERGVVVRWGRVVGERTPGLQLIVPIADVMHHVPLCEVALPVRLSSLEALDGVAFDVQALVWLRVVDATALLVSLESVEAGLERTLSSTLRTTLGQHVSVALLREPDCVCEDVGPALCAALLGCGVEPVGVALVRVATSAGVHARPVATTSYAGVAGPVPRRAELRSAWRRTARAA